MKQKLRRSKNFQLDPMSIFDEPSLLATLEEHEIKPVHAPAIYKYLLQTPGAQLADLDTVQGLPVGLGAILATRFCLLTSRVVSASTSSDESTTKLLVELQDGLRVETVVIRHGASTARCVTGESRTTLCVSSQVGCKMACSFCATGTMGELGNLSTGEILEQLIHARAYSPIRNIVFMGMGEPLNNYEAVVGAVRAMIDRQRFQLAPSHVTVSTVGVPRMREFHYDLPKVHMALSLHAPTQALRAQIVPAGKGFPLSELMEAVDGYIASRANRRLLIEYVLLEGVNDSDTHAHQMGQLLKDRAVIVNLIPYNATEVLAQYRAPSRAQIHSFKAILWEEYHVMVTVRKTMGADKDSACGQLVLQKQPTDSGGTGIQTTDIEDMRVAGLVDKITGDPVVRAGANGTALWPRTVVPDKTDNNGQQPTGSKPRNTPCPLNGQPRTYLLKGLKAAGGVYVALTVAYMLHAYA